MPEGDTVWNTARMLHRALAGDVVRHSDFRVPDLATVDLAGFTIHGCVSRGKHLLLRVTREERLTIHSHLRMDGAWRVFAPGEAWRGRHSHVIRAVLRASSAVAVGYHLHDLAILPTDDEEKLVGHLGPDLLGPPGEPGGWDLDEAVRRVKTSPARPIAEALLDQTNLAGIGNLYKCELLFLRGLWPWTPVWQIDDLPGLLTLAQRVLAANRGRWTQVTTGSLRRGQETYVYGRGRAPCRRCGTPVAYDNPGTSTDRVTYWCPVCQPESD
ncbi:Fpg/Nei family DNA glycosylase [Luedemannella flava]|uniref:DNA-(apurinic or apyrimidinic site) lyase n=1 Tax=Luedemannella flava TaxID=349316 RepID=A0ABN2MCN2_9ACTN